MRRLSGGACLLVLISIAAIACNPTFNWRQFSSTDGFTILLPARPQTVVRDVMMPGATVQMQMTSTGIGATLFAVGTARLPSSLSGDAATRQQVLDFLRDGLVRNVSGGRVKVSRVALAVPPNDARRVLAGESIEAVGVGSNGRAVRLAARLFIVDDRLFQVTALGAEGEITPDTLDTFFSSFQLI